MGNFIIQGDLEEAYRLLEEFISDKKNIDAIEAAGGALSSAFKSGNKVISCGNGGSMSDAMHFAEELSGRFREERRALPALSISDPSYISCVSNDWGWEKVFSRYVEALGNRGDVLLAISTSGNSINIIKAIEVAKERGMIVIGLTGRGGGEMAKLCDIEIRAPWSQYADRAQEIHIKVIHSLIHFIENNLD